MKYQNPVLKGFYPDPSVCKVNGTYYLVCSSFQYFPGVPLFESKDLINWTQIGHCLTRTSQVQLDTVSSSGGVFAPTIRYHNGRFYMVTTNDSLRQNFYVWTEDIYGEWSEPIFVDQGGIDPSLFFEGDKTYFISNGADEDGVSGIVQCEINIETGAKLSKSKTIWQGSGGRYLESPHMYKINGMYYLFAAEGGTEYGHMETYARATTPYGEFEGYAKNPMLTNRNLGGFEIQGVGHGDLIQDDQGNWFMLHLGFRQIGQYATFHHLGRETFLTPVYLDENGWFYVKDGGTTKENYELEYVECTTMQQKLQNDTFSNTSVNKEWCFLRFPKEENYRMEDKAFYLKGTEVTLDDVASPTFIGIRQRDFEAEISCKVTVEDGEAGMTIYMDENHHYDLGIRYYEGQYEVFERLNIGDIKSVEQSVKLQDMNHPELIIRSHKDKYSFSVKVENKEIYLGSAQTRYLSSEVAGGFTGVMIGLYAVKGNQECFAKFEEFRCEYK